MFLLFSSVIGYIWLNSFITINALYINQIKSLEKEKTVFEVFNYDKHILGTRLHNDTESVFEKPFLDKINEKRKRNQVKPLNQIKHDDTVNVVFDKGLFGFKYLK